MENCPQATTELPEGTQPLVRDRMGRAPYYAPLPESSPQLSERAPGCHSVGMAMDIEKLYEMNMEIGIAEAEGQSDFFRERLAPAFAMRRASGSTEGRETFIGKVAHSGGRDTQILSISILGRNRAAVDCIVELDGKRYANFRLFTRESPDADWQLLAWANEPLDLM